MSLTTVTPVTAYFPDELVRSLSVEVRAGGVAAVGEVEVAPGSIRALDDAQRHAYRRVASKARSGLARHDYSATVRRVDQSPSRIEAISENVRSELSHAGWRWPDPTGPSTLAALDYFVPASFRPGAPLAAVSLRVVDDVGSETSAENVKSFERVLAFELVGAGFEVGKDPADLTIDVEVEELTAGSRGQRIVSFRHGHAILSYTVTVSRPSGEVLGRSDGARRLGDKLFARDNPNIMSSAWITELLIAQSAGDIVDDAQILHE